MSDASVWWLMAGAAVVVELLTGTFYLLMIALGLAAGAVAAHLGASVVLQLVAGAVVAAGSVFAWHFMRARQPKDAPANENRDVNLDIGETVQITRWNADGTAHVKYRGAQWTAEHEAGAVPGTGAHRIKSVVGSRLIVEKT